MAGPRITRLSDPANPYGKKKTPTAGPTTAQQAVNRAVSQKIAANIPKPPVKPAPKAAGDSAYMTARKRRIDGLVDGKIKR